VNEEVLGFNSLSEDASNRFFSFPLVWASRSEGGGEPDGNQIFAYGVTGMLRSAWITCVSGATSGGLATGKPTNTWVRGAMNLQWEMLD
jgi:hypothetical protein